MPQFLPTDYKIPSSSNFFKFAPGLNKFRILGSAVIGWEYWTEDRKPIRSKSMPSSTPGIKLEKDGNPSKVKHFWAFPVYNWEEKRIQIMQVSQISIMDGISALVENEDWGDPTTYNIAVTRAGEGLDTTYVVQPSPKTEMPPEVLRDFNALNLTSDSLLQSLLENKDPFAVAN